MANTKKQSVHEKTRDEHLELRDKLLEATLPHVAFDGWTPRALEAGEEASGLGEGAAYRAFPDLSLIHI